MSEATPMAIDSIAVLNITHLATPPTEFGTCYPLEHRGDATLFNK